MREIKKVNPSTCVYCRMETTNPHVDHRIPRVLGGNATPQNAVIACSWCNLSKGPRPYPVNPPPGYVGPWPPDHWD
ncbi:HNH endonuclease [Microcella sp.]|uniref:HNH endonuclease n=1 Tax=Microcella sp. TaxID=1913979 RepID=UPI00391B01EB